MQEASPNALLDLLKNLQAPIGAVLGALAHWIFNRWKQRPETSILEATAEKTRAEARRLDSETINSAHDRIDELVAVNYQLRKDCLAMQKKIDMADIRDKFNDEQRRKMKALLDVHGIKYSEFDEPKS